MTDFQFKRKAELDSDIDPRWSLRFKPIYLVSTAFVQSFVLQGVREGSRIKASVETVVSQDTSRQQRSLGPQHHCLAYARSNCHMPMFKFALSSLDANRFLKAVIVYLPL